MNMDNGNFGFALMYVILAAWTLFALYVGSKYTPTEKKH